MESYVKYQYDIQNKQITSNFQMFCDVDKKIKWNYVKTQKIKLKKQALMKVFYA